MNIIACVKIVPDDQDITVKDSGELSFANAKPSISSFDLNAIEAGAQIYEALGGTFVALSVGDASTDDSKTKKNILSRGPESLTLVADDALLGADTYQTACALKAAVEKLDAWDLILCGSGSADRYAQQVGTQLGCLLGVPTLNGVSHIEAAEGKLVVERTLEDCIQTFEVALPAVITVTSDINTPRIASMKQVLAAGKKPSTVLSAADVAFDAAATTAEVETRAPKKANRAQDIVMGDGDDNIAEFTAKLKELLR